MSHGWEARYRTCIAEGCDQPQAARSRCRRHYQEWYRQNRADRKRESDRAWRERTDYNATRRKPPVERACADPECGEIFTTAIPHQRFHSPKCKKRIENAKRTERKAA